MNKNKTKKLISIISAFLILCVSGVVAATLTAKEISFTSNSKEWEVKNVNEAMDDLYIRQNELLDKKSFLTFGMVFKYGIGDHIAEILEYNSNIVSVSDNNITFNKSGTVNVSLGFHCDNGKDFVGYVLNGVKVDLSEHINTSSGYGMDEFQLNVNEGDTLYFLSSNTVANRRTTYFGLLSFAE